MISYKEFAVLLEEKLILTHPIPICKNQIERIFSSIGFWVNFAFNEEKNIFSVNFNGVPNINHLEYIEHEMRTLGYYFSYFNCYKKIGRKGFPWIDINDYVEKTKNVENVEILFESKFDKKLEYVPEKLFHSTLISKISKIKKNGLSPKFDIRSGHNHPERVYLSLSYSNCLNILKQKKLRDKLEGYKQEYCIIEIDTTNLNGLVLYKDPNSKGVYTYNHFNPLELIFHNI